MSFTAIVVPAKEAIYEVELVGELGHGLLRSLQKLVGGYIEALPIPEFVSGCNDATAYVNEDGKYTEGCEPNMRATDFMVPGAGLLPGDYIAGTFVLVGFDPVTGTHRKQLPDGVIKRIRLIESEAGY